MQCLKLKADSVAKRLTKLNCKQQGTVYGCVEKNQWTTGIKFCREEHDKKRPGAEGVELCRALPYALKDSLKKRKK